jgi:hypothetical protein
MAPIHPLLAAAAHTTQYSYPELEAAIELGAAGVAGLAKKASAAGISLEIAAKVVSAGSTAGLQSEMILWRPDDGSAPLDEWLLGWVDGPEGQYWTPLLRTAEGWRWSRDVESPPQGTIVLMWAKGPAGLRDIASPRLALTPLRPVPPLYPEGYQSLGHATADLRAAWQTLVFDCISPPLTWIARTVTRAADLVRFNRAGY